jgi:hypothetical protein
VGDGVALAAAPDQLRELRAALRHGEVVDLQEPAQHRAVRGHAAVHARQWQRRRDAHHRESRPARRHASKPSIRFLSAFYPLSICVLVWFLSAFLSWFLSMA